MNILLSVDGSAYTKRMLAYLTTHDGVFGQKNDYTLFSVQLPLLPHAHAAIRQGGGRWVPPRSGGEGDRAGGEISAAPRH